MSVGFLTACSSSSKMSGKTYNYVYGGDPATLDYLAANKKNMTTAVSNGVDGLAPFLCTVIDDTLFPNLMELLKVSLPKFLVSNFE
ncbi:MAG: hypothetical protein E7K50_01705, partial [Streptococcus thermophilus]|nr:hypothetical protein [Streptococcus thermophilus]